MKNRKGTLLCLYVLASIVIGFFCAGFLHAFLTNSVQMLSIKFLFVLLGSSRQFLLLFFSITVFLLLCCLVFSLDNKPYKSALTEVAQGISIPVSAGQLQHGSARFLTEEEIDQSFASVVLPKSIVNNKKEDMLYNVRDDLADKEMEQNA